MKLYREEDVFAFPRVRWLRRNVNPSRAKAIVRLDRAYCLRDQEPDEETETSSKKWKRKKRKRNVTSVTYMYVNFGRACSVANPRSFEQSLKRRVTNNVSSGRSGP